jgi:integrase
MATTHRKPRVTGSLRLIDRRDGPVWYARTRVPGRDPEDTVRRLAAAHLGGGKPRKGTLTRRQAEDALADLLADERRKVGERSYEHESEGATFADAAAGYLHHLEHVKGRSFGTLRDYRHSLTRYLLPRWGERPVASITPSEVAALRDELLARKPKPLSPRSVVRHLMVTHGVFKHAVREHGLARNPASAELVDRPTVTYTGGFDTFDADELAALARAAADEQDTAIYLAAAYTGLRQGELLALRWSDIDFAGQRVHVRRSWCQHSRAEKAPKSGRVRSVPLVDELIGPLDRLSRREHFTDPDDLVFCNVTGEHLGAHNVRRRYERALERAGLRRVRFHDLRHCFGSTAVRAFPLSDVQAMLGHAHVTTTMRYVHHRPGADDAAKLSGAFRGENDSPLYPEPYPETADSGATERN